MIPIPTLLGGFTFVGLAAVSVITMFEASRPARAAETKRRLIAVHRIAGYLFVTVFFVMAWGMIPRLMGTNLSEVPFNVVVHVLFVLILIPLLLLKITIARRYKQWHVVLAPLGLAILTIAFATVALPVMSILLRSIRPGGIGPVTSVFLVAAWIAGVGMLAIWRPGHRPARADRDAAPVRQPEMTRLVLSTVRRETHDTKTLRFTIQGGKQLSAKPGQFMTFHWMIQGKRVPRSYTISSSPSQTGYLEITPKRIENGLVSRFLHDEALPGLTVEASGPHGMFCFDKSIHRNIVMLAGGSGITPMMSMLRYIEELGLPTVVTLLYCVRTSRDIIFKTDLERLRSSLIQFKYGFVLSQPDANWQGRSGHLTWDLIREHVANLNESTFFLCGPQGFMDKARELLTSAGVEQGRIHQESFGVRPASIPSPGESVATVEFVRSQRVCDSPAGSTLLEVAEANGISIPFSCRQGQCGTCATRVLRGTVRMETCEGLTREQIDAGFVLPCISRADGTVVLGV